MARRDPLNPKYFPLGRGKCRECGAPRYRQGRCREHFYEKRRQEYREKSPVRDKKCPTCGTTFRAFTTIQRFCSRKCCDRAKTIRERKGEFKKQICKTCGAWFQQARSNHVFCSEKCGWDYKKTPQVRLRLTKGLIDATCEQCGAPFKHKMRSSDRKGRFCSYDCWYKSNSGTSSPLKRDGIFHEAPPSVWSELCAFIRERDGHRCTACHAEKRTRSHPVDHIVPRRMVHGWGGDPHMIANLVTLCQSCHGRKLHAESKIIKGDFVGFILGLAAMHYPMHRVEEAFRQYGLPLQMFREMEASA